MSEACELTTLMPCLYEAETLRSCIFQARAFLARRGRTGDVVIAELTVTRVCLAAYPW
jgi:hypothetical protein